MPRYFELLLGWHSRFRLHYLDVVESDVGIWETQFLRDLLFGDVEHFGVFCESKAAVGTVEVLDEGVSSVACGLRRRLAPSLTLLLADLAVADSATLFALQICMA